VLECIVWILILSCVLYYAGSGVKTIEADFSGFSVRLFFFVHVCSWLMYGWIFCTAVLMSVCAAVIVISSA